MSNTQICLDIQHKSHVKGSFSVWESWPDPFEFGDKRPADVNGDRI